MAAVLHMERWDNGTLYSFYHCGKLLECLKRLKCVENSASVAGDFGENYDCRTN